MTTNRTTEKTMTLEATADTKADMKAGTKVVSRKPLGNRDRVTTPFREPRQQDYEHALHRRIASWPDNSAAEWLTNQVKDYLNGRPNVTTENVTGMLFALACEGLKNVKGKRHEVEALLDTLRAGDVDAMLLRLSEISAMRINKAKRVFLDDPDNLTAREDFEAARYPQVMHRLLGTDGTCPWDAQQDGHLVMRETARALGIVRWCKAETAERRARINEAFSSTLSFGPRAGRLWTDRRPIVVIDAVTAYTAKLVGDLWTADPSIGVLLCPPLPKQSSGGAQMRVTSNPFDAFEIPFVVDEHAWLHALLGIDHFPVLIEPRLGGFTMTAAIGTIDVREARKKGRFRPTPAPIWMRTLSEIALLKRFDEVTTKVAEPHKPVDYAAWEERYRLLRDFPVVDSFVVKHAPQFSPRVMEAVLRQRESFLKLRDNIRTTLESLALQQAAEQMAKADADSAFGFDFEKATED